MAVLVVDDSVSIRSLLAAVLVDMGIDCLQAESGEQALEFFSREQIFPSLVVLDIQLPGIDGYLTAEKIKAIVGDRHLPIIFMSGINDPHALSKCLEIGDDFIPKPFSVEMISLKVKAHRRVSHLYQQLESQFLELKRYQRHIKLEHDIVETIFANHFARHIKKTDSFNYHISPKSVFNGDVLLTAIGPSGNLYMAIGDVTGHGLPAAVGAIPVYSTFRSMAKKGISIGLIATEMNRSLRSLLPDNMMFAASLLELNSSADTLTVWSGGMPSMILANAAGTIKQLIEPQHCPLAMLLPHEFSQDVQVYKVNPTDKIYLFTDGVEECRNNNDEMFGESRLHALFDGYDTRMFERILRELDKFRGDHEQDDDITLVELNCVPMDESSGKNTQEYEHSIALLPWSLEVKLGVNEIKSTSPVPEIIRLLSNASGIDVHQDYISTVLSELYGNALEHGLLKLDSSIKDTGDGFIEYYNLRRKRLEDLQEGCIAVRLTLSRKDSSSIVNIQVQDSGDGFDYLSAKSTKNEESYGRGIDILRELCHEVKYSDGGRCVTVTYVIQ
jgi:serine phosphatase RsbU (regulator of sigma subunit)